MSGPAYSPAPEPELGAEPQSPRQDTSAPAFGAEGLLRLQRLAGNRAVGTLPQLQVQREPVAAPKTGFAFDGRMYTTDRTQLRHLLDELVAEKGQADAETVAYRMLRMSMEDKLGLQLKSVEVELIGKVQAEFEAVLAEQQAEHQKWVGDFQAAVAKDTEDLLLKSREELKAEEYKFTETLPGHEMPDMDAMRKAANELAAKRKLADAAAATANTTHRTMIDQNQGHAAFPAIGGVTPQVPYFPNPQLRDQAGKASDAWWALEKEYGALRAEKEKAFPSLAMFAYNDDGKAFDRLDDLPTWGPWADSRMIDKVWSEVRKRISNNETALKDIKDDPAKIWTLRQMVDRTLKSQSAKAYHQRWARDRAAKEAKERQEKEELIAAVAIGLAVVTVALTAGAALPAAGTAAAAVVGGAAAGAQALSTVVTIASAYRHLEQYRTELAESDTALDRTNAIAAAGDPSLFWLAFDIAAAIMDVGAARSAFQAFGKSIAAAKQTRDVARLSTELAELGAAHNVPKATVDSVLAKVTAEVQSLPAQIRIVEAETALQRLATLDSLAPAERGQALLDALQASDVMTVLSRSGKSAEELLALVAKDSAAGIQLIGKLNRHAFDTMAPRLRALGLDDAAVARIVTMADVDKIKGQILEEMLNLEVRQAIEGTDEAAKAKMLRGTNEGAAEMIPGHRITDTEGQALTDGILGVLRESEEGKEIVVIRAFEGKAGKATRQQLSMKALRSKNSRLLAMSIDDQNELIANAIEELRNRRPDLKELSNTAIADQHPQDVLDIIEKQQKFKENEWGQAHKTSQRLGTDLHPTLDKEIPAEILVDGQRRKVRFPGKEGRPQVTGVLPSDVPAGKLGPTVSAKQGVTLDITNVKGVSAKDLNDLAIQIGEAKGIKPKQ
jgi:hypothetical protein